jgi:hypothetical protein
MAAGNSNYDALLSTTMANYRDTFSDNISKSFALMYWLTSGGRKRSEDGGEAIIVQLMYGKNTTVKSYDGYEVLDTTPQEGMTAARFPWKQVAGSVSISRKEERQNSGESRIINLLESKVKQAEISVRDKLNEMWFSDGTGNDSKDMFGLALLVENGAAWGSVAGIDRSDALNAWWRNQYSATAVQFTAAYSTAVGLMRTMYNNCSRGNEHPDLIITAQTPYEGYESGLLTLERFEDKDIADVGFQNLKFKGCVMVYDEQCTANHMYFLNSDYLEYVVDSQTDMITTPFVRPENQDAKVSQILIMGNLVSSNCARQGVLTNVTG